MASTQQGLPSPTGAGSGSSPANGSTAATNPKMRKRTKTGCLTCRKRRIKCGEERPTCINCIKSKRNCEGYNQRVVFKQPIGEWPTNPSVVSTLEYHSSLLPGSRAPAYRTQNQHESPMMHHPRPITQFDFSNVETGPVPGLDTSGQHVLVGGHSPYPQDPNYQPPLQSPHHQLPTPTSATTSYFPTQPSPLHSHFPGHYGQEGSAGYQMQQFPQSGHYQQVPVSYDTHLSEQKPAVSEASHPVSQTYQEQPIYQQVRRASNIQEDHSVYGLGAHMSPRAETYPQYGEHRASLSQAGNPRAHVSQAQPSPAHMSSAGPYHPPAAPSHMQAHPPSSRTNFPPVQIPQHDVNPDVKYMAQHTVLEESAAAARSAQALQPQLLTSGFGGEDHVSPTQILDEAAVEIEDDDYYDVNSDEDMPDEEMLDQNDDDDAKMITNRDFSLILRLHEESTSELAIRRYDSFIYQGILDYYRAERVANPLRNPKTARVFAHFVYVTGPSISIFERNPRNPAALFEGVTHPSLQSLWTYLLPSKALNNQGLLHAMLALASLHIARLQGASATPSYRHYAYSLKRLHRSLENPTKRYQLTTLATSMLLAFYEVMTAEHVKWSTHLVGARYLITELDYRRMTQEARRLQASETAYEKQFIYQNPDMMVNQKQFQQTLNDGSLMVDQGLVSTIVGKKVNYDDFGSVEEMGHSERRNTIPPQIDLRTYETFQDLYWWYCRQDAYQSIVSANPLIMDYRKWSDCPPRAPWGRRDALYGSHDHIFLLIGRIADFTVRDRTRKLRQMAADGGSWKPGPGLATVPGMRMGPPPSPFQGAPPTQLPTPTTPIPPNIPGAAGSSPSGWAGPPPSGWTGAALPQMPDRKPSLQIPVAQSPNFTPSPNQQHPQQGPPPSNTIPPFFGMAPSRPPISVPSSYINNTQYPHQYPQTPVTPLTPSTSSLTEAYNQALAEWTSILQAYTQMSQLLSSTPTFAPLTPDLYPPCPPSPFGPPVLHRSHGISIIWTLLYSCHILLMRSHPAMPPAAMQAAAVCSPATSQSCALIGRICSGLQLPNSSTVPLNPSLGATLIESTMPLFFAGITYTDPAQREWLITRLLEINKRTGWASAGIIARSCETSWERAMQMGRGPKYEKRRTRRPGEEGPVVLSENEDVGGTGASGNGSGSGEGKSRDVSSAGGSYSRPTTAGAQEARKVDMVDKRFIMKIGAVKPWAMGLLAADEDLSDSMEKVGLR